MALRILVLDDEPIVCKRLKPAFQKSGYEVETFTDSAAALQRMAESKFDVIITDLKMEGADGFQVLERARELLPQARIVVITGFATLDTAKEDRKSTRLNSSHVRISYAVFCLKKKKIK